MSLPENPVPLPAGEDDNHDSDGSGTPVGRRVVLGMLGLGALGVALGSRLSSAGTALAASDPTGVTALIPGAGGYRYFSVVGSVPPVPSSEYSLSVRPAPDAKPVTVTYAELEALKQTKFTRDVQCVTGWRVPDVAWTGVTLRDLLEHVGADTTAAGVAFGSFDGEYTESLTMVQALRPDVLVATRMEGAPITHDHGGPVRLYVAPMYFYKSLKWLGSVSVVDTVTPGYWEQKGYDDDAWVGASNGLHDEPV